MILCCFISLRFAKEGQECVLSCAQGKAFSNGDLTRLTTCSGGIWSLPITECSDVANFGRLVNIKSVQFVGEQTA